MLEMIQKEIQAQKDILDETLTQLGNYIYTACMISMDTLANEKKILIFGDGDSALEAKRLASNIVGCYSTGRGALGAISLVESINGVKDEDVFKRQVEALANEGDLLIAFYVDGESTNVTKALKYGKSIGCRSIGFSGNEEIQMSEYCDILVAIPSSKRSEIVATHTTLGHIIAQSIDNAKI